MNILRLSLSVALLLTVLHCCTAASTGHSDKTSVEPQDPNASKDDPCECRCPGGECCGEEETTAERKKRDVGTTTVGPKDAGVVAQPGFVRPARRRKLCFGRRKEFTEECGPRRRAYKTRNFVMSSAVIANGGAGGLAGAQSGAQSGAVVSMLSNSGTGGGGGAGGVASGGASAGTGGVVV